MTPEAGAQAPVEVITWHLEMRDPGQLRAAPMPAVPPTVLRAAQPFPAFNRFLYTAVGGAWYWQDRLAWSWQDWMRWLDRPELQTWVVYEAGMPAGYAELERQPGDQVEIAYFGLAPPFQGRGLGAYFLSEVTLKAWAMQARRVWVHTCSLDHPAALRNYQARGYTVFRSETERRVLPQKPPGPWPGAY